MRILVLVNLAELRYANADVLLAVFGNKNLVLGNVADTQRHVNQFCHCLLLFESGFDGRFATTGWREKNLARIRVCHSGTR